MPDFLTNLANRTLGNSPVVKPQIAPLFAPPTALMTQVGLPMLDPVRGPSMAERGSAIAISNQDSLAGNSVTLPTEMPPEMQPTQAPRPTDSTAESAQSLLPPASPMTPALSGATSDSERAGHEPALLPEDKPQPADAQAKPAQPPSSLPMTPQLVPAAPALTTEQTTQMDTVSDADEPDADDTLLQDNASSTVRRPLPSLVDMAAGKSLAQAADAQTSVVRTSAAQSSVAQSSVAQPSAAHDDDNTPEVTVAKVPTQPKRAQADLSTPLVRPVQPSMLVSADSGSEPARSSILASETLVAEGQPKSQRLVAQPHDAAARQDSESQQRVPTAQMMAQTQTPPRSASFDSASTQSVRGPSAAPHLMPIQDSLLAETLTHLALDAAQAKTAHAQDERQMAMPRPAAQVADSHAPIERETQAPTLQVSIGRVEVKAVPPPPPPPPATPPARTQPVVSLNDYLKQRGERRR